MNSSNSWTIILLTAIYFVSISAQDENVTARKPDIIGPRNRQVSQSYRRQSPDVISLKSPTQSDYISNYKRTPTNQNLSQSLDVSRNNYDPFHIKYVIQSSKQSNQTSSTHQQNQLNNLSILNPPSNVEAAIEKLCDDDQTPVFVGNSPTHHQFNANNSQANYVCQSIKQSCKKWGICSQKCEQDEESKLIKCSCSTGYYLAEDKFTCKSSSNVTALVIYSIRNEIKSYELDSKSTHQRPKPLITGLKNSIALDFFYQPKGGYIFWTDVAEERIYRGTIADGSVTNVDFIVQGGLATAEGLAVDWIGRNIYWVESTLDQIEVASINGTGRHALIAGGIENPRAIALDPRYGYLFWSDWDKTNPRIERASMSGEDRQTIYRMRVNNSWPNGLTLDYDNVRLYWIDASTDSIHSTDYDGKDYIEILKDQTFFGHPFAITLFENNVYWTDWRTSSVSMANKFTGSNTIGIQRMSSRPFDIKVYHPNRQPKMMSNLHPCMVNNGNCSQLCLISTSSTRKCACAQLMMLASDQRTCVPDEKVLLIGKPNEISVLSIKQPLYHIVSPISISKIVYPKQFEFDARTKRIFWVDSHLNEVKRVHLTASSIETIIDVIIESPTAIALDWLSRNIYVTSTKPKQSSKIYISNLDGEYISVLLDSSNGLIAPRSLAVHPTLGLLFMVDEWSVNDKESGNYETIIAMFGMDGSDKRIVSKRSTNSKLENPSNLTVDYETNRLYWINSKENASSIQYYDITEEKVHTIWDDSLMSSGEQINPTVMCIDGGFLIFNSRNQTKFDHLFKAPIDNLKNRTILKSQNLEELSAIKVYNASVQSGSNVCSYNNGGCSQLCVPSNSTHRRCKCTIGFNTNPVNETQCIGKDEFLIFAYNWGMRGVSLEPGSSSDDLYLPPIHKAYKASSIDFVHKDNLIYWVDSDEGSIARINRDTTGYKVIVQNLEQEESISIDWVAGNIYWIDPYYDIIEVARLNGSNRYVIVSGNMDRANNIVVAPLYGYIAWSDSGTPPKIEVARLDGSDRKVIVNSTLGHIYDLAIDHQENFIYWLDSINHRVERVKPDGSHRHQILPHPSTTELIQSFHHPVGIAVFRDHLYVADSIYHSGSIVRYNKKHMNQTKEEIIQHDLGDGIKDIAIFSSQTIPSSNYNPCSKNNGGCEDLCFFMGEKGLRKCVCYHGQLMKDGVSCQPYDTFVMYSWLHQIDSLHIKYSDSPGNSPYKQIVQDNRSSIISLALDYEAQRIIYSEIAEGQICSIHFNGSDHKILVEKQGFVEGVTFMENQLFWTSISDCTISRLNTTSSGVRRICQQSETCTESTVEKLVRLTSDDKPRGIVFDKCSSYIYWTNWNNNNPSIQRASPTKGYQVESIITTAIKVPNGITIDHQQRKLYWCDARLDKIEYCDMDGTNRLILLQQSTQHPFALAVWGDHVVWTDWLVRGVFKANKYNGYNITQVKKMAHRPMGIVVASPDIYECPSDQCTIITCQSEETCISKRGIETCVSKVNSSHDVVSPPRYHCNQTENITQCNFSTVDVNDQLDLRNIVENKKTIDIDSVKWVTSNSSLTPTTTEDIHISTSKTDKQTFASSTSTTAKPSNVDSTNTQKYNNAQDNSTVNTINGNQKDDRLYPDKTGCGIKQFRCYLSEITICIDQESICDGKNDCLANEDEFQCKDTPDAAGKLKSHQNWQQFFLIIAFVITALLLAMILTFGGKGHRRRWLSMNNNGFSHRRLFDENCRSNIEISNPMFDKDDSGDVLQCPFSIDLNERSTNFTNPLLIVGPRRGKDYDGEEVEWNLR